jgi:hypothetical protein
VVLPKKRKCCRQPCCWMFLSICKTPHLHDCFVCMCVCIFCIYIYVCVYVCVSTCIYVITHYVCVHTQVYYVVSSSILDQGVIFTHDVSWKTSPWPAGHGYRSFPWIPGSGANKTPKSLVTYSGWSVAFHPQQELQSSTKIAKREKTPNT